MRAISLLQVLILSAPAMAQTGFYLRPSVEQKANVMAEKPFSFETDQGNVVEVVPTRVIYPGGLSIGLSAGYKAANWFLEIGTFQDGALAGARINYTLLNEPIGQGGVNYVMQNSSYYHGHGYGRRSISYGFRLSGDRPLAASRRTKWQLWGTAGIDLWRRPPGTAESPTGGLWYFNERDSMSYFADMQAPLRTAWFLNAGLMLKAFNSKGHSIVNLSLFYSQAVSRNRSMTVSALTFTNYTDGKQYRQWIRSLGSGLYFQISKDIYINNLIKRLRKQKVE